MPGTPRTGRAAAIVFDFDGVLADSEAAHGRALESAASILGLRAPSERLRWYVGFGDAECFRQMAAATGRPLNDSDLSLLIDAKATAFAHLCNGGGAVAFPGAVELVRQAAGVAPVAVCSGSRRRDIEPLLEGFGVRTMLSALVTADDVLRTKPDPTSYLLTAERLGLPPCRCIAIEDSPAGVAAGRAAGYLRVHAVCTFGRQELGEADNIHDCIADLTPSLLLG